MSRVQIIHMKCQVLLALKKKTKKKKHFRVLSATILLSAVRVKNYFGKGGLLIHSEVFSNDLSACSF